MIKNVEPLLKECEETLKELKRMGNMEVACYVQGFINSINKLPDADQRPHGEWIPKAVHNCWTRFECSVCGYYHEPVHDFGESKPNFNFCPNCGADMRKKVDEGGEKC